MGNLEEITEQPPTVTGDGSLRDRLAQTPEPISPVSLSFTSTPVADILAEIGFNEAETTALLSRLTQFPSKLRRDQFESKLSQLDILLQQSAERELGLGMTTLTEEVHATGEAIFWAHMYGSFDPAFPDRMVTVNASSYGEYKEVEGQLEVFMKTVLFNPESPLLKILKQEVENTNRTIQSEFIRGLLKPFIDCYDDRSNLSWLGRLLSEIEAFFHEQTPGLADQNLTPREEDVIRTIAGTTVHADPNAGKADLKDPKTIADDSSRITLILDSYVGRPLRGVLVALEKELARRPSLSEPVVARILGLASGNAQTSNNTDLRRIVSEEMLRRNIDDPNVTSQDVFQHAIALVSLMCMQSASPDFTKRLAPLMEKAFLAAEAERSTWFAESYRANLRRLSATILIEKQREFGFP